MAKDVLNDAPATQIKKRSKIVNVFVNRFATVAMATVAARAGDAAGGGGAAADGGADADGHASTGASDDAQRESARRRRDSSSRVLRERLVRVLATLAGMCVRMSEAPAAQAAQTLSIRSEISSHVSNALGKVR